jgi:hypothetical protein
MKMHQLIASVFFLCLMPFWAFAGWQVASPGTAVPREPFFQPGYGNSAGPTQYGGNVRRPAAVYAISMSGSLKENLERIMGRYHWKVIWKADYDFNFDGRVSGSSLSKVVEKLLQPFPLQAVMYMSNRTVTVMPRSKLGNENNVS